LLQDCELQVFGGLDLVAHRSGDNTVEADKIGEWGSDFLTPSSRASRGELVASYTEASATQTLVEIKPVAGSRKEHLVTVLQFGNGRQIGSALVQVGLDVAVKELHPAKHQLFADLGRQLGDGLLDRLVADLYRPEPLPGGRIGRGEREGGKGQGKWVRRGTARRRPRV
jgi:hypothetical protein